MTDTVPKRFLIPVYIPMDETGTERLVVGGGVKEGDVIRIQLNDKVGSRLLQRMIDNERPIALSITSQEDKKKLAEGASDADVPSES